MVDGRIDEIRMGWDWGVVTALYGAKRVDVMMFEECVEVIERRERDGLEGWKQIWGCYVWWDGDIFDEVVIRYIL